MTSEPSPDIPDPRMRRAITEIKGMIADRYPGTTFSVEQGFDPDGTSHVPVAFDCDGTYLTATVDVDDTDEIYDLVIHRLGQLQVQEGLPLYLSVVQTPARLTRLLAAQQPSSYRNGRADLSALRCGRPGRQ